MNEHCSHRVWEDSNQKGAALLLLLAIAHEADPSGFASPTLQALARKIRMSVRHTSRLVAGLQSAGELLVLPRPGRRHLFIVLTGTNRQLLAAALREAAARGATVDGLLDPTQDSLSSEIRLEKC
jgi:DNA-binding MarR family transcriptional regulator